ncbi:MAG TPA: deoxyribose-phosphate aldolase [Flavipsychrobacter sp.]|nr:deoxyribose-phosphate aldolase [Flavipsychrobacter sp.]
MRIASYIDHTLLKPTTIAADVDKICSEAREYGFAAVCIPPCYVQRANSFLQDDPVKIATVIGFPFGYSNTESKLKEIEKALQQGADELDMVIQLAALKNGNWTKVEADVKACITLIHNEQKQMKLIVESGLLTEEELIRCCRIVEQNNIDFIKTSTGYAEAGATVHAVKIMREHLPDTIRIKASGGIRNFSFAKELIVAGAARLGCSASVQIVSESDTLSN